MWSEVSAVSVMRMKGYLISSVECPVILTAWWQRCPHKACQRNYTTHIGCCQWQVLERVIGRALSAVSWLSQQGSGRKGLAIEVPLANRSEIRGMSTFSVFKIKAASNYDAHEHPTPYGTSLKAHKSTACRSRSLHDRKPCALMPAFGVRGFRLQAAG